MPSQTGHKYQKAAQSLCQNQRLFTPILSFYFLAWGKETLSSEAIQHPPGMAGLPFPPEQSSPSTLNAQQSQLYSR